MKAYLQRHKPETMELWFYAIQIQQDLLGRWQVIRNWGKSGSSGTMQQKPYETLDEAVIAFQALKRQLLDKGFRVVMQEGLRPAMAVYLKGGMRVDSSDT